MSNFMKIMVRAALLTIVGLVIFFGQSASPVRAAALYFDVSEISVGLDGTFKTALLMDAEEAVNAVEISVDLPEWLEVVDASGGGSIINFWITSPAFDARRGVFSLSGIIPGGYSGRSGRLVVLTLRANEVGAGRISYDLLSSRAMLARPAPVPDELKAAPLRISAIAGKHNLDNEIPDLDPPEKFLIYTATTSPGSLDSWTLYFDAADKGSGIEKYEISSHRYPNMSDGRSSWRLITSPHRLSTTDLTRYLYIKATDKQGNSRTEVIPPVLGRSWSSGVIWSIITALAAAALLSLWLKRSRQS